MAVFSKVLSVFPAVFLAALSFSLLASASSNDIHTFAGIGSANYHGDNGPAVEAGMNLPAGLAVDAAGSVYVADRGNSVVRKVDAGGIITTVAGTGNAGYSGDSLLKYSRGVSRIFKGVQATASDLNSPGGVAVDTLGNIYIADTANNRIRMVMASGEILSIAGDGTAGYSGDGGPAESARVNRPEGVAVDSAGNIYVADTGNNRIRMIGPNGVITTVAGTGTAGYSGDWLGAVFAKLDHPVAVAADGRGNVYVADYNNNRVRKFSPSGVITTFAGNGSAGYSGDGGQAASASLDHPAGVAVDGSGEVYITEAYGNRVRKVDAAGIISTFAGNGVAGFSGDGGPAAAAQVNSPAGLAMDASGNVYIADSANNRVRMVEGPAYLLPVSTLITPQTGDTIAAGSYKVSGKASAASGVAFVEVSTDGGTTWDLASGGEAFSYSWTPPGSGQYVLLSRSTDSFGRLEKIMSCADVAVSADAVIVVNLLTASVASPAAAGDTVVWTAGASGGSGSYEYQFLRSGPDTGGNYVVTRDWGTSNTWSWTTTSSMAGDGTVMVKVRNIDGSGLVSKSVSYTVQVLASIIIASINPSIPSAVTGDTVVWTASASGGNGSLQYQFLRRGPDTSGAYVIEQDWGSLNTWSWTTGLPAAGINTVMVNVMNSDGSGSVSTMTSQAYTVSAPTNSGLVGYWKFDEASLIFAADSSGLRNDGTLSGVSLVDGISGGAVSFNGTGGYVLVPGTAKLMPASAVSVTAWVNTTTTPAMGGEVVSMGDNYVLRVLSDGNAFFFIYNGATWITVQTTGVNVKDGRWHHLAGVKTAGQLQVYVDGALKAVYGTADTIPYALGTGLYIGTHGNGSSNYNFNGFIDEVRVYNRDLSATEVKAIYEGNAPQVVTTPVTVGSLTSSPASATVGATVTWSASASGGTGSLQYQFSRSGPDTGGSYVVSRAFGTSNTWSWTTTSAMAGKNTIKVDVRNSDGTGQVSMVSPAYYVGYPAIVVNSLTASVASPATAGDTVVWTASASGGNGSNEYQFSRSGPDTNGSYVVSKAFGTSNTWSWNTTSVMAGSNTIKVDVRNSDGTGQVSKTAAYTVSAPAVSGLVGYWKFDEASGTLAADSSGLGDTGTLSGTSRAAGVSGNAVSLDGTGGYVLVPGTASLMPASTVSVTAWANTSTTPARGGEVASMGDSYSLRVLADGNVLFFIYNGTTWVTVQTTGVNVKDGRWHHLAGVKSAGQLQVYVDGALKAVYGTTDAISYSLGNGLYVGKHGNGSSLDDFNGYIDEVRVYDRGLSASEVQAVYASITPPAVTAPITVGSLTPSAATATSGATVTWTASASGGTGSLQFQFSRSGPDTGGSYVVARAFGSSNTWSWTTAAAMAGSNTIKVDVRNSDGTGQVSKTAAYTLAAQIPTGGAYYISPSGSDSNSGTLSSPWKTIRYASSRLSPGDTLYVRGGTYTGEGSGSSVPFRSGTSSAPVTVKAYPGESPVFDGGLSIQYLMVFSNVGYVVIDGITVQRYAYGGIYIYSGANNITIQNCTFRNIGTNANQHHGVYISSPNVSNVTVRNNLFQNNAGAGIHAWHGPNANGVRIYNNVITGGQWGIILGDGAQNIEIYNNTIDHTDYGIDFGLAGQDVSTGVTNVTMKNNIISNSTYYGMRVGSFNVNDVSGDYNLWYNNRVDVSWSGSSWSLSQYKSNIANEQHSVSANPAYVNAAAGDYRLILGSPAIDAGATVSSVITDFDGILRTQGRAYDIGAYEYH